MINIKHLKHITILSFILLIFGCRNDSEVESPNSTSTPEAAILEVPNNNEICLTGKSLNATQSTVTFIWQAAKYATTYDLIIKNLKSMQTSTYTSNSTFKEVTLLKGEPYSWWVVSKSDNTPKSEQSSVWKFYLANDGIPVYAPFPATIIYPTSGHTINAWNGNIYLEWEAIDVDDDIIGYDVYFDTENGSTIMVENHPNKKLENISVESNTIYYWKIITKDKSGNSSSSAVYTFKVQ